MTQKDSQTKKTHRFKNPIELGLSTTEMLWEETTYLIHTPRCDGLGKGFNIHTYTLYNYWNTE